MKEAYDKYITDILLPRYCDGNVSEDEYRIVKEWIGLSDEHLRIAQQINSLYLAADTLRVKKELDIDKALSGVNKQIKKKNNISLFQYIQKIAAILFIPLLLAYTFQFFKTEKQVVAEMIKVRTNPGMITRLVLPDSSIVILNSETTFEYPSSFNQDTRPVILDGEAFFEVTQNKKQQFIVSTPWNTRIEVTGTKFNVDAYKNKSFVSVTLTEGNIHFLFKENSGYKRIAMQAGNKALYDNQLSKTKIFNTSGRSETAWKDGKIIFENTSFDEALRMLEKRYHVEFTIKNTRFKNDSFSGEFTSQRLDRILEYFKLSSNIHWRYIETDHEKEEKTKIEIY